MHLIRGLLTRSPFSYLRKNPDFQYMTTDLPAFRSLDWFQLVFTLRYPHTYLYIYIYIKFSKVVDLYSVLIITAKA